jgi:hypothetical protein
LRKLTMLRPPLLPPERAAEDANVAPSTPRGLFFDMVEDIASRERLPFHVAMGKAKLEQPEAFRAAFPFDARQSAQPTAKCRLGLVDPAAHASQRELLPV